MLGKRTKASQSQSGTSQSNDQASHLTKVSSQEAERREERGRSRGGGGGKKGRGREPRQGEGGKHTRRARKREREREKQEPTGEKREQERGGAVKCRSIQDSSNIILKQCNTARV